MKYQSKKNRKQLQTAKDSKQPQTTNEIPIKEKPAKDNTQTTANY